MITINNTYQYKYGNVYDKKYRYRIDLDGNGIFAANYTGSYHRADGSTKITRYGKVNDNDYTINVNTKDDMAPSCTLIAGEGTLLQ
ncbi:MAG: hypothetical protein E7277_05020 [Lachnospiraceae bacterium]|jgi:hypothetical protein|nr:hypothetical protein [Lachnospiraceae bacterium]